jgi:hypothetical protein
MFQRYESLYELRSTLPLENFAILPEGSENRCIYCGMDLYEILFEDEYNVYARCRLCNALWIVPEKSRNYANSVPML